MRRRKMSLHRHTQFCAQVFDFYQYTHRLSFDNVLMPIVRDIFLIHLKYTDPMLHKTCSSQEEARVARMIRPAEDHH